MSLATLNVSLDQFYQYWLDKDSKTVDKLIVVKSYFEALAVQGSVRDDKYIMQTDVRKFASLLSIPRKADADIINRLKEQKKIAIDQFTMLQTL